MLKNAIEMFKIDFYKKIDKITIGNGLNECKLNGQNDSCNESLKVLGKIYYIFPQWMLILETEALQKATNHPVHHINKDGEFSPTALIPFCEFGGKMSIMGVQIDKFDVHVCNSFRPKIIKDQLCYTVDPNKYKEYLQPEDELGLTLFINYNEDRQISTLEHLNFSITDSSPSEEHFIIVDTIGKYN